MTEQTLFKYFEDGWEIEEEQIIQIVEYIKGKYLKKTKLEGVFDFRVIGKNKNESNKRKLENECICTTLT